MPLLPSLVTSVVLSLLAFGLYAVTNTPLFAVVCFSIGCFLIDLVKYLKSRRKG